jgi:electron transport complex protein RnfC
LATKTFVGGVHPVYNKERTAGQSIELAKVPNVLVFPMSQHIGAPCQPLVKVGDRVLQGQKIGESEAKVCVPVHSSVSGKVIAVENRAHPRGQMGLAVVVENDGKDEQAPPFADPRGWEELSPAEIVHIVREAGIAGLGGAAFPTHVKLVPPATATIDAVILNGAECEPFLTSDHRVMVERAGQVIEGLRIILKAVGVNKGYIGIEENKPDAILALTQEIAGDANIEVVPLKVKYPQGSELQLIHSILGREVPSGKLPADAGVVVNNVGTAAAIAEAVLTCRPMIQRVVTVTGSLVENPKNLLVRLGTPFRDLLEQCGLKGQPAKVINGGPMMGVTQGTLDVPVIKGVSGIVVLSEAEAAPLEPRECVRCARCVDACPISLQPLFLAQFAEHEMWDKAKAYHALDCKECGACSFICPSRRPLVQNIRLAKRHILAKRNNG